MGGIGLINVLLPGLVKRDFPDRIALITGLYTTAFCAGAAGAAGATAPLARRSAAPGARRSRPGRCLPRSRPRSGPSTRRPAIWQDGAARVRGLGGPARLAGHLFMGLQSALAYVVLSWLPPILRDRGLPRWRRDWSCPSRSSRKPQPVCSRPRWRRAAGPELATVQRGALRRRPARLFLRSARHDLDMGRASSGSPGRAHQHRHDRDRAPLAGRPRGRPSLRHGPGRRLHPLLGRSHADRHAARLDGRAGPRLPCSARGLGAAAALSAGSRPGAPVRVRTEA